MPETAAPLLRGTSSRLERQAEKMRLEAKHAKEEAARAKLATEFVKTPFWTDLIKPMLDGDIRAFEESVYTMDQADFARFQGRAHGFKILRDRIENLVGKEEQLLKAADKKAARLEEEERAGRIKMQE